jgi:hypothetical protein
VGRRLIAPLLLALPLPGCLEDRLSVEITMQIHADGTCTRRTEYQLERVDRDTGRRSSIPPSEDALVRLHRFPPPDRWLRADDRRDDRHLLTLEASLPSPNDIDWDYWRQRSSRTPPARNYVSFATEEDDGITVYDYTETFRDPASPLTAARTLAQLLLKNDSRFAELLDKELDVAAIPRREAQRLFRDRLAEPFTRRVGSLTHRPIHGPREQKEIERLLKELEADQARLARELAERVPAVDAEDVETAVDRAMSVLAEHLDRDLASQGLELALLLPEDASRLRFRLTLTMPGPIVRANTCVQGDTAVWEFTGDDLFGHGFDIWARAVVPR